MKDSILSVLVTGFAPFPNAPNHPSWIRDHIAPDQRTPAANPSAWVAERIGQNLAGQDVEIHRLFPLPVTYGAAGTMVVDAIRRHAPHLVLSFGLGARARVEGEAPADAELELTAKNLRHDDKGLPEQGEPRRCFLPDAWPPTDDPESWTDEDRAWLQRFPDNTGLSCSNTRILGDGPMILKTRFDLAPLRDRVASIQINGSSLVPLLDDNPDGAAGRFICNEVYYQGLFEQAKRNTDALFVHLPPLDEDREPRILAAADAILEGCIVQIQDRIS